MLCKLRLLTHSTGSIFHIIHLDFRCPADSFVSHISVRSHCFTLNLEAEQCCFFILQIVKLSLIFSQSLEFLIPFSIFIVSDICNIHCRYKNSESVGNLILDAIFDVLTDLTDQAIEVHNKNTRVFRSISHNLLDFLQQNCLESLFELFQRRIARTPGFQHILDILRFLWKFNSNCSLNGNANVIGLVLRFGWNDSEIRHCEPYFHSTFQIDEKHFCLEWGTTSIGKANNGCQRREIVCLDSNVFRTDNNIVGTVILIQKNRSLPRMNTKAATITDSILFF